jgi:signal peptidase I
MRRHTKQLEEQPVTKTAEHKTERVSDQVSDILRFVIKLLSMCLVLWFIFTFVFGICLMDGESMYPSIKDGDLILYFRMEPDYSIGDVVAYEMDGSLRIGRIVAQGGDEVDLSEDKLLMVNGNVESEAIFYPTERAEDGIFFPYKVADDSYFILGDMRTTSTDSRNFGLVSKSRLRGKVITLLRRRGI